MTRPAEKREREDSLVISLRELREVERDRLQREEESDRLRLEESARAEDAARRVEAERAEAERRARERDREREHERREREEREERIRIAEAERRARVQAETELARQRLLLEIEAGRRRSPERGTRAAILPSAAILLAAAAVTFGVLWRLEADRAEAYAVRLDRAERDGDREAEASRRARGELARLLASRAASVPRPAAAAVAPELPRPAGAQARPGGGPQRPPRPKPVAATVPKVTLCDPADPLGCIGGEKGGVAKGGRVR